MNEFKTTLLLNLTDMGFLYRRPADDQIRQAFLAANPGCINVANNLDMVMDIMHKTIPPELALANQITDGEYRWQLFKAAIIQAFPEPTVSSGIIAEMKPKLALTLGLADT